MTEPPFVADGRAVIAREHQALAELGQRLDDNFARACHALLECTGRVVVVGMGKSSHIGGKIASTLASTGTPAFFVHPGEASHGDLGMIMPGDLVIAISNSGETPEVLTILPIIKRMGVTLLAMTGRTTSSLGVAADVCLDVSVEREACPHNLAPTASTTATLAMGDALAVAVLKARDFSADDFARSHPGGALGRRLLGMIGVIDDDGLLCGIYTDGDLRRSLNQGVDVNRCKVGSVMVQKPHTIPATTLAAEVVELMQRHSINGVFVVDADGRPAGALNALDLIRAGVF
jgi:arabinose-5-phosphate isomerase